MRRPYNKVRRAETEAQTKERIVEATVELHAQHGARGTSHAMIAQKAGLSPQTVYNHFPSLGALVGGCTSHVISRAPIVNGTCFESAKSVAARLRALAAAAYRQLAYMAPWLRLGWAEAEAIPQLHDVFARGQSALRRLVKEAVSPEYRATPEFLDAAMLLLDYPAWKSFSHGRSRAKAAELAGECLVALLPILAQATTKDTP
jgi:AcrR family transcriptional regulator